MRIADAPVIVLGAGATKASGGLMTNEILPSLFTKRLVTTQHGLTDLEDLLVDVFAVPRKHTKRTAADFPPLPLLLSLVDTAIDRKEPIAPGWPIARLARVRNAIEFAFYFVLERALRNVRTNPHTDLFEKVRRSCGRLPPVISLNYDLVADNTLFHLAGCFPDFGCDVATEAYRENKLDATPLLKLHGSLSWLYCSTCHRLDVALAVDGMMKKFPGHLPMRKRFDSTSCRSCSEPMGSVMITPTFRKDYRNPHVSRVWYEAERELRKAKRVVFIGYSLPEDDVEVIYLLKRGLYGKSAKQITVVEMASESGRHHDVRRRYEQLFGTGIDWHDSGFEGWLRTVGDDLRTV